MNTSNAVLSSEANPLLQSFDKIYIINLVHRTDRREEMRVELAKVGISLEHPNVYLFPAVKPDTFEGWPSRGAKGCFMSHLGILQHAKAQGYQSILILEDDINFNDGFLQAFSPISSLLLSQPWDIFYGGYELLSPEHEVLTPLEASASSCLSTIQASTPVRTTHFVGFNGAAMTQVTDYLAQMAAREAGDPNGGPMHVDGAYSWFRKDHPSMITWLATPQLGYQRSSATDIADKKWFDRLPVVSQGVALLRKLKNLLK